VVSHCCESVAVAAVRLVVHRLDWLTSVSEKKAAYCS